MADRDKVIKTLESILDADIYEDWLSGEDRQDVCDGIAMLKGQEAKEVKVSTNMYTGLPITHCPKCGVSIDRYLYGRQYEGQVNYCPYCGQAVKWK